MKSVLDVLSTFFLTVLKLSSKLKAANKGTSSKTYSSTSLKVHLKE